jgi:curved DNA-binding protein CbpA
VAGSSPDPYRVLGVAATASPAQITHAYRARLRAHHPDTRTSPASPAADDGLQQVLAAYAVLRDPARRADYDRQAASLRTPAPVRVVATSTEPAHSGPIDIPITFRRGQRSPVKNPALDLRVGPVRRHRSRGCPK